MAGLGRLAGLVRLGVSGGRGLGEVGGDGGCGEPAVLMTEGGVVTVEGFPEVFPVKMGIDLGCGNTFVSEHFLDGPEVCAPFHQVGGKRMPEGMGRDRLGDTSFGGEVLDHVKDHHPGKRASAAVEKNDVFLSGFDGYVHPDVFPVKPDVFERVPPDGDQAFLVPLADHADKTYFRVKTGEP